MRILVLTLTMIHVHNLPPGFYTYFLATANFTDSYFFLTPLPPNFLIIHQWISFLFVICKAHFLFPMVALNNVDPVLVSLSPLCLSVNTVLAAKIPLQLSFPKTIAEREDLKQTLPFLSLHCDEQNPEHFFPFPTETILSYTTFLPGLVFNFVFHKYIPQIWIATFLQSGNWMLFLGSNA